MTDDEAATVRGLVFAGVVVAVVKKCFLAARSRRGASARCHIGKQSATRSIKARRVDSGRAIERLDLQVALTNQGKPFSNEDLSRKRRIVHVERQSRPPGTGEERIRVVNIDFRGEERGTDGN